PDASAHIRRFAAYRLLLFDFKIRIPSPLESLSSFHAHAYRLTDNFRAGDSIHVGTERPSLEKCTCRRRKVKCGEERPVCKRCFNLRLSCEWGVPVKRGSRATAAVRHLQPAQPRADPPSPATYSPGIIPAAYSNTLATLWHQPPGPSTDLNTGPSLQTAWSFLPLYPSLSVSDLACSNSLVLSEHDQKYFQYFPSSSVVFYYMKAWQWSAFCYLYQGPAASNKVIMRMILALSASDMHRSGLVVRSPGRPTAEDHARYHYGLAVKEFRQLLETPNREVSQAELEMILATMFLMVTYEWQFGHCSRHLQLHLQGVRSLLESHPELFQIKDVNDVLLSMDAEQPEEPFRVSFIPEQFLLWMLYIDVNSRSVGLSGSLFDYVLRSGNPALHPDRLHRCARLWGRCFWGKQYPDQEVSDDMENYRALELLHEGMCLRHKTWQVLVDQTGFKDAKSLFSEMMAIREKYSDLFITAKFAGATSPRRTLNTINMAVATFYAQLLFHRRLLYSTVPATALHRQALTTILEISQKQCVADPRLLRRLHWPMLMAVIETEDLVARDWLRQRLSELREYHSEYIWANEIADDVLARQEMSGQPVDLADVLRRHLYQ
ncbi:Zn(II)2Cys6 transcription factor, partial [Aspergillus thermomutatus]